MKKAFTLIELLVVVLIIGILSAIALPQYTKAVAKSRVAEVLLLGRSIVKAQQIYKMANGTYATSLDDLDIGYPCTMSEYSGSGTGVLGTLTCTHSHGFLYESFVSLYADKVDGFWINFSFAGSATCSEAEGIKVPGLCVSLGGTYTETDSDNIKRYAL